MSINLCFYKNVFLLMQAVPPSLECTNRFNKEMFDKPNPSGFIHMSHYLLSIHDSKRFKKAVTWPILSKDDEKQYRLGVKKYLDIIAAENPDIKFPPILMFHIIRAGSKKFLTIMWKLSQISLRAYIMRHYNGKLLLAPESGDTSNITRIYITNINFKRDLDISKHSEETKLDIESFEYYMQCKFTDLKNLQADIFSTIENIKKCAQVAPVNKVILKRLVDPKDIEIINMWKTNIHANIEHLNYMNSNLNRSKTLSRKLINIFSSLHTDAIVCDANNFSKINTEDIDNGLYINGCLVIYSLILKLDEILKEIECHLKLSNLSNLSNCEITINEYNKIMRSMEETFQKFILEITSSTSTLQNSLQERSANFSVEKDSFYFLCRKVLFPSPQFQFHFDESIIEKDLINELYVSPKKGKYKYLFKRYQKDKLDSPKSSSLNSSYTSNVGVNTTSWLSPKRHFSSYEKTPPKINNNRTVSPRYSKLFTPRKRATSSPIKQRIENSPKSTNHNINLQPVNLEVAMQNIYDLSTQIAKIAASIPKS
ncbi:uncharacterized protein LOC116431362 [Nomia melanderi]|uniref:uncharacterized protein LOC116431362 n=1 Tax=Nomia melanderi TaxID=2448451 RepID=UPI0013042CAF|nr:uncharacterized protein LOC116431362 [Nomia melanderi]XP_031842519.1 uncharacterized protein LOC116431362 [Nomia melanderi]